MQIVRISETTQLKNKSISRKYLSEIAETFPQSLDLLQSTGSWKGIVLDPKGKQIQVEIQTIAVN